MVAFAEGGERLVGQPAKRQAVTNPSNTLYGVKRLIGRKFADADVQAQLATSPFAMSAASNGDTRVDIEGKSMSPPEISARVLMKMKQASEAYLGEPVTEAVVPVPAYFDNTQR
jgi:molecular chaperone DnaK